MRPRQRASQQQIDRPILPHHHLMQTLPDRLDALQKNPHPLSRHRIRLSLKCHSSSRLFMWHGRLARGSCLCTTGILPVPLTPLYERSSTSSPASAPPPSPSTPPASSSSPPLSAPSPYSNPSSPPHRLSN